MYNKKVLYVRAVLYVSFNASLSELERLSC